MCGASRGWLGRRKARGGSCSSGGGGQSMLLCHSVVIPQELLGWEEGVRMGVDGKGSIWAWPDGAPPLPPSHTSRSACMHLKISPQSRMVPSSPRTPRTPPTPLDPPPYIRRSPHSP